MPVQPLLLTAQQIRAHDEVRVAHPLNPKSEMYYTPLTEQAEFRHGGLHRVRLPPHRESNELHSHRVEEEFYFVLEGRAMLRIGDAEHELGPGDFAAFSAGSAARMMTNPFDEDLVYLVGGSRSPFEMGDFPRHGKSFIRAAGEMWVVDTDRLEQPDWRFTEDDRED